MGMQISSTAAQTVLSKRDAKMGVSYMFFLQGLGGAIWVSIAQLLFTSQLSKGLTSLSATTHISAEKIVNTGATELRNLLPPADLKLVLDVYNEALRRPFILCVALSAMTIFAGLLMEWRNIKGLKEGGSEAGVRKSVDKERRDEKDLESA